MVICFKAYIIYFILIVDVESCGVDESCVGPI